MLTRNFCRDFELEVESENDVEELLHHESSSACRSTVHGSPIDSSYLGDISSVEAERRDISTPAVLDNVSALEEQYGRSSPPVFDYRKIERFAATAPQVA